MATADTKSAIPPLDRKRPAPTETALLALGCFWSPDAQFGVLPGVVRTSSGYAGGTKENPTYHALGDHTETVEVEYDPEHISYEDLLAVFWESHNPAKQSFKRQYMSALFVLDEEQKERAHASRAHAGRDTGGEIQTEIKIVRRFYLAEDYHQNYRLRQVPALERVYTELYPDPEDFAHSPAASRVNGYVAGYGNEEQLETDIDRLGLSPDLQQQLRQRRRRQGRSGSLFG